MKQIILLKYTFYEHVNVPNIEEQGIIRLQKLTWKKPGLGHHYTCNEFIILYTKNWTFTGTSILARSQLL